MTERFWFRSGFQAVTTTQKTARAQHTVQRCHSLLRRTRVWTRVKTGVWHAAGDGRPMLAVQNAEQLLVNAPRLSGRPIDLIAISGTKTIPRLRLKI